jgi:hypothetical protein
MEEKGSYSANYGYFCEPPEPEQQPDHPSLTSLVERENNLREQKLMHYPW